MFEEPKKITNRVDILDKCREYMQKRDEGKFLYALKDRKQNLIYDGVAIMGIQTSEDAITITLTNGDSNYSVPCGTIDYFDIEYIQECNS